MRRKNKYYILIPLLLLCLLLSSCDKEVFTGYEIKTENLSGTLVINSNPPGASIYFEGRISGFTTPTTIEFLQPGEHVISLRKKLYSDSTFTVFISDSSSTNVFIDLNANPKNLGKIFCNSTPQSAKIFINDQETGFFTPETIFNVSPGIYEVKYAKGNYRTDSSNILVRALLTSTYNSILSDTTTWVDYSVSNSDLPTNSFNDVVEYKNEMWFASNGYGLINYDGKDWTVYSLASLGTVNSNVNKLLVHGDDLWICTDGQLIRFNDGIKNSYRNEFLAPEFNSVVADDEDNIWCGSSNGVTMFDGTNWHSLQSESIDLKHVTALKIINNNELLIGTAFHDHDGPGYKSGILCKYSNGDFEILKTSTNIYNPVSIYCLEVDESNNIWYSARFGLFTAYSRIYIIPVEGSEYELIIKSINRPSQFSRFASFGNGEVMASSSRGFHVFKILGNEEFFNTQNSNLKDAELTSVFVNGNNIAWITSMNGGVTKYKR
ncbi:MAG: PEGA domain-containing protein [Bacteroidetes bacterium]|nr:PEGA domain-containing protein [Bacteroidota bacterium]